MIPKIHASGSSFRGVMAYCLGDKREDRPISAEAEAQDVRDLQRLNQALEGDDDALLAQYGDFNVALRRAAAIERRLEDLERWEKAQAARPHYAGGEQSKRVAWTETLNLDTDNPRQAARRMAATASYSQELKRQAGIAPGGRRLEKPVCHYTLSWKEGEKPGKAEQLKAVKESLEALGMADRQAVVVAHRDGKCAHVHVVVNRVSWEDGRAAKLSRSRAALSKWAERWERERGKVQCKQRARNNRERRKGRSVYDRESRIRDQKMRRGQSRKPVYINRRKMSDGRNASEARYVARFRVVERNMAEQASKLSKSRRADLLAKQRAEWSDLLSRQRSEKSKAAEIGSRAVKAVEREIRTSREEQAIGQAVGQTLGEKLQKLAEARGGVSQLEERHKGERAELRGKHADELAAHYERAQVDFYEKPMRRAEKDGYEIDQYDDKSRAAFKQELAWQGFVERYQRYQGPEMDVGPSW